MSGVARKEAHTTDVVAQALQQVGCNGQTCMHAACMAAHVRRDAAGQDSYFEPCSVSEFRSNSVLIATQQSGYRLILSLIQTSARLSRSAAGQDSCFEPCSASEFRSNTYSSHQMQERRSPRGWRNNWTIDYLHAAACKRERTRSPVQRGGRVNLQKIVQRLQRTKAGVRRENVTGAILSGTEVP